MNWPKLKWPFESALRGIGGEFEITRVLGGFGALAYCVCANVFVGWSVIVERQDFDVTAYCLAFPGGLAAIIAAAAGSANWKDRGVATSRVIAETGSKPATPPAPAPVAQPGLGKPDNPEGEA